MGDHHLGQRIAGALPDATPFGTAPEIARILMKQYWTKAFGKHVADRLVRVPGSQALGVALAALAVGPIIVLQLVEAGVGRREQKQRIIEGILGSDGQFLLRRQRGACEIRAGGSIVGQNSQYALATGGLLLQRVDWGGGLR